MNRISITLALMLILSVFTAPVIAQSDSEDCGLFDGVTSDCDDSSIFESIWGIASAYSGLMDRKLAEFGIGAPDDSTPQDALDHIQTEFNSDSDQWVDWVNENYSQSVYESESMTVEVTFKDDGESATKYLIADFDADGDITSAEVVDDTSNTVEEEVVIRGLAVDAAQEEYDEFSLHKVKSGQTPDLAYIANKATKYCSYINLTELNLYDKANLTSTQQSIVDSAC